MSQQFCGLLSNPVWQVLSKINSFFN